MTIDVSGSPQPWSALLEAKNTHIPVATNVSGGSVYPVPDAISREFLRLGLFRNELDDIIAWCDLAKEETASDSAREAAALTAIVRFVGCFSGTKGLRQQPLSKKAIFSPEDRKLLEALRQVRNTEVAHDDQVAPGSLALLILDAAAEALSVNAVQMTSHYSTSNHIDDVLRLSYLARSWILEAFERAAADIVARFNALPVEERQALKASALDFHIQMERVDSPDRSNVPG